VIKPQYEYDSGYDSDYYDENALIPKKRPKLYSNNQVLGNKNQCQRK
jgi:hypothetical protein